MMRQEFIPIGACVEGPDVALFQSPETAEAAGRACMSCVQLENCQKQQVAIASLLALGGDELRPVVAGEVVVPHPVASPIVAPVLELGEPTLRFTFQPLPTDGTRGLRAIQQAMRTGQLYDVSQRPIGASRHPTIDIPAQYEAMFREDYPEHTGILQGYPNLISVISRMVMSGTVRRTKIGDISRAASRFDDFSLAAYYPIVRQFIAEATEVNELGILPKRALYHSPTFFKKHLEACAAEGITESRAIGVANDGITGLQALAQRLVEQQRIRGQRRRRSKHAANSAGDEQLRAEYPALEKLVACNAVSVNSEGQLCFTDLTRHFNKIEKSAILYAFGLDKLYWRCAGRDTIQKTTGMSPEQLTFTVLLPHMHPDIRRAYEDPLALATPTRLLAAVRHGLAIGAVHTYSGQQDPKPIVRREFPYDQRTLAVVHNPASLKGLALLYRHTERYLELQGQVLSMSEFRAMATLYLRDLLYIQQRGQPNAPRVAVYFDAKTYSAIYEYAATKPGISPCDVRQGFSRCTVPLKLPNTIIVHRQGVRKALPSAHDFSETHIARLAARGVTGPEVRKLCMLIEELQERYGETFTGKDIITYCASHDVSNWTAVRETFAFKAQRAQAARQKYPNDPRLTMAANRSILHAKPGTETTALEAFLRSKKPLK